MDDEGRGVPAGTLAVLDGDGTVLAEVPVTMEDPDAAILRCRGEARVAQSGVPDIYAWRNPAGEPVVSGPAEEIGFPPGEHLGPGRPIGLDFTVAADGFGGSMRATDGHRARHLATLAAELTRGAGS